METGLNSVSNVFAKISLLLFPVVFIKGTHVGELLTTRWNLGALEVLSLLTRNICDYQGTLFAFYI